MFLNASYSILFIVSLPYPAWRQWLSGSGSCFNGEPLPVWFPSLLSTMSCWGAFTAPREEITAPSWHWQMEPFHLLHFQAISMKECTGFNIHLEKGFGAAVALWANSPPLISKAADSTGRRKGGRGGGGCQLPCPGCTIQLCARTWDAALVYWCVSVQRATEESSQMLWQS